jgi:hypothetical protein
MVIKSQKEKEKFICAAIDKYLASGLKKSEAVRRVMSDFNYATEAAIYNIYKRNQKGGKHD